MGGGATRRRATRSGAARTPALIRPPAFDAGQWSRRPRLRGCLPPVAETSCSAEREQAPPCPVCDAGRWSCHRRFVRATTPPQWSPARDTFPSAGLSSPNACRQGGTHSGTVRTGRGSKGGSRGGTTGIRGAGLVFGKSGMALPATLSLTRAPRRPYDGSAAVARLPSQWPRRAI